MGRMAQRRAEAVTSSWAARPGAGTGSAAGAAADGPAGDIVLNIGPQHPSTHGMLRLRLTLDGERIPSAEPIVGYMHRGAEKLFEARDYRQIIMLANRHDWLSRVRQRARRRARRRAACSAWRCRSAAVWTRTLLAELNRVLTHLMFLGSYPLELGGVQRPRLACALPEREEMLQACMEEVSGGRMHYMFNRVGGLKEDLPRLAGPSARPRSRACGLPGIGWTTVLGNETFRPAPAGVGVLTREHVHAVRGERTVARASGVDFDLRRDEPYLAYGELGGDPAGGDPAARATAWPGSRCLLEQIARRPSTWPRVCLDRLASCRPGRSTPRLPKVLKAPGGPDVRVDREPARAQRLLPGLQGREDAVAAQAALRVVQQHPGAHRAAARHPGRRHGRDPGLDVLRRRRHRQVATAERVSAWGGVAAGGDERAAALPGDDQPAVPQHLHGVPHGLVRDPVLLRQAALRRQLMGNLSRLDPHGDVVCDLHVRKVRAERIHW